MTREEAIKILRSKIRTDSFDESFEEIMMDCALTMAIADMEKQIPKKPIWIKRSITKFQVCPCCSNAEHYQMVFKQQKYCVECGQALDWSEEND